MSIYRTFRVQLYLDDDRKPHDSQFKLNAAQAVGDLCVHRQQDSLKRVAVINSPDGPEHSLDYLAHLPLSELVMMLEQESVHALRFEWDSHNGGESIVDEIVAARQ